MDVYDDVPTQSTCMKFLSCVWKIISCIFTHFILVTMVVSYCLLGALMFEYLEKDYEELIKKNITYMRHNVSADLWRFTVDEKVLAQTNWSKYAMDRIKLYESDLINAIRKDGWDGIENTSTVQWTFSGSLFFSIIVITTIGYGHIAPKTQMGKIATILYAIVGIPMMLLCLSNIGDMMANSFRFLYWKVCCFACTRSNKRRNSTRRSRSVRSNHRSRTASLRGQRPSQRSVDSAIYLPEIQQPYFDNGNEQGALYGSKEDNRVARGKSIHRMDTTSQSTSNQAGGPVLCNIYALDPDEAFRAKQVRSSTLPPRGIGDREENERKSARSLKENRNTLSVDVAMAPHKLRSTPDLSVKQESYTRNPSPSVMSPMGFIMHRSRGGADSYPSSYSDYEESIGGPASATKPVPIWLCVLLVVSYIMGGAFLFSGWEEWDFFDSAYFCFITLTTIGFGDFVPAQQASRGTSTPRDTQIRIGLCSLYLLFGIALLAMSFNLVQEEVINNVKSIARHLGILKDESQDDTDEE